MTSEDKPAIKHDYHWVRFDRTKYWTDKFLAEIGPDAKIIQTFVFDHNSVTHFCEFTPSYVLHLAGTDYTTSRELSDAERDDIDEKIRESTMFDECEENHHCHTIDGRREMGVEIPGKSHPVTQFVGCDDDVTIDDVIEHYQANPW